MKIRLQKLIRKVRYAFMPKPKGRPEELMHKWGKVLGWSRKDITSVTSSSEEFN